MLFELDWVTATIDYDSLDLQDSLQELAEVYDAGVRSSRAMHGYEFCACLVDDEDQVVCRIMWGGNPRLYVSASGEDSRILASYLKSLPRKDVVYVSRADYYIDYDEVGVFDLFLDFVRNEFITAFPHLKVQITGDYLTNQGKGRTIYVGSRQSPLMLRVYEKGREQGDPESSWVRFEWEIKPKNIHARTQFFALAPTDLVTSSAWSAYIFSYLRGERFGRSQVRLTGEYRPSDLDRSLLHLKKQYGQIMFDIFRLRCDGCPYKFHELLIGGFDNEACD